MKRLNQTSGQPVGNTDTNPGKKGLGNNIVVQSHVEDVVGGLDHDKTGVHHVEIVKTLQKSRVRGEGDLLGVKAAQLKVVVLVDPVHGFRRKSEWKK